MQPSAASVSSASQRLVERERLGGAHAARARRGTARRLGRPGRRGCPSRPARRPGRARAPRARRGPAGRPGPARRGSRGCRRPGGRPPCGSGRLGATLQRQGTRRRDRVDVGDGRSRRSPSTRGGEQVQHRVGRPAHGDVEAPWRSRTPRWWRWTAAAPSRRPRRTSGWPGRPPAVPASPNSVAAGGGVASVEPLPGSDRPERLGQAVHRVGGEHARARAAGRAGVLLDAAASVLVGDGLRRRPPAMRGRSGPAAVVGTTPAIGRRPCPASIGPPETKTVGMFSRSAASSMPGVILSQLEMQTSASAQCAFTMYSTESAISSRLGSE